MVVASAAGPLESVFVSGSTIRGAYRHACADVWLEREKTVSIQRYLEVKVGGVKGSGETPRVGLTERAAYLERDLFLDLFGAGRSPIGWMHSRLDVGAALPEEPTQPILVNGARRDATSDPEAARGARRRRARGGATTASAANRRRSQAATQARELARRIRQAKRAGQDTVELEHVHDADAPRRGTDAARDQSELVGSDVSLLLALPGYEAIPTGTVLTHRMFCRHVSQRQMALLMGGLARFAEDPRFGAHRAQGCGRVCVEYAVKRMEGTHAHAAGTVSIDPERWDAEGSSLALSGAPERWLREWEAGAP